MRRRKLYRYSQSHHRPMIGAGYMTHEMQQHLLNTGIAIGVQMATERAKRPSSAREQVDLARINREPFMAMARHNGFEAGFAAGMKAAQKAEAPKAERFTYSDVENARRRGFQEGKSSASTSIDSKAVRSRIRDEMLEQCRVIAESNPNMAPGVNAVRHRIKKIK